MVSHFPASRSERPLDHVFEETRLASNQDASTRPLDAGSDPAKQVLAGNEQDEGTVHPPVLGGYARADR